MPPRLAVVGLLSSLASAIALAHDDPQVSPAAFAADDECPSKDADAGDEGGSCGLGLLQFRGRKLHSKAEAAAKEPGLVPASPALEPAPPTLLGAKADAAATGSVLGFRSMAAYEAYEDSIDDILEDIFKDVVHYGGYMESGIQLEDTWRVCTDIDWTATAASPDFDHTMQQLGFANECDSKTGKFRTDPTCLAIQAGAKATYKLERLFPAGPKFVNYLLVDWGQRPSWRQGTVLVDNSQMPPNATVLDPNGANGYGFCDLVRTVLSQSANQMQSGTCGYVASLAALSHAAPAKAIKMGIRLMWTGRPTRLIELPCDYIFEQKPGLVPFVDSSGNVRPADFGHNPEVACTGNAQDCQNGAGRPLQNAGVTFMWSQSLISSFSRTLTKSCAADPAKLNYPGQSNEAKGFISDVQGQTGGSSLWACDAVIDPRGGTCDIEFNHGICGELSDDECQLLMTYQIDGFEKGKIDTVILDTVDQLSDFVGDVEVVRQMFVENRTRFMAAIREKVQAVQQVSVSAGQYGTYVQKLLDSVGIDAFFVTANVFTPSANDAVLDRACKEPVAMLAVDAEPLQGNDANSPSAPLAGPFFPTEREAGSCNHMVYLEACDVAHNVYTLWTWGTRRYVTRELLLGQPANITTGLVAPRTASTFNTGIVCFVTFAKQISWAPLNPSPHFVLGARRR